MSKSKKTEFVVRPCWPHPLLEIKPGMPPIAGSACAKPVVDDYDIYIGFDTMRFTERHLPWTPGVEIEYRIRDRGVPGDVNTYRELLGWTLAQMEGGARVHAGCIGGHGRTGMFFAALVAVATGRKDAINYVREHYCKKACETKTQIDFLVKHFDVDAVKESKVYTPSVTPWTNGGKNIFHGDTTWVDEGEYGGKAIVPLVNSKTIWGDSLYFDGDEFDV